MSILFIIVSIVIGYILGSLPTALIIGKAVKGVDVREYGSKNLGATNAGRVLGKKYFYIVTIIDASKCIIAILINLLLYRLFFRPLSSDIYTSGLALSGTFAMIGHCFPIFAGFKGGKGVATAIGYLLITNPLAALVTLIAFLIIVKLKKMISLGSLLSTIVVLIYIWLTFIIFKESYSFMGLKMHLNIYYCLITTLLGVFVIIRHKANIKRLIEHNENTI